MALLGVILLLLGAGAGVVAYLATRGGAGTVAVTALGFSRNATPLELMLYGAVTVLLFALGWALLSAAARRRVRQRREEKGEARVTELEDKAEDIRRDHERRLDDAGLRDEDLRRREDQLAARHEGLDKREAELDRRESEWREREGRSVADVERPAETGASRRDELDERADHGDPLDRDRDGRDDRVEHRPPTEERGRDSTA